MRHQSISATAAALSATEAELNELHGQGWISTVEKNGIVFVSEQQGYKARFILHLRHKLSLTNDEIALVLDAEEPPYSLKDVPGILGREVTNQ